MEAPLSPGHPNPDGLPGPQDADACSTAIIPASWLEGALPALYWAGGRAQGVAFLGLSAALEAIVVRRDRPGASVWLDVVDRDDLALADGQLPDALRQVLNVADAAAVEATAALEKRTRKAEDRRAPGAPVTYPPE